MPMPYRGVVHALYPEQVNNSLFYIQILNRIIRHSAGVNMPFFEFLLSRLKTGGTITLASNIPAYIEEAEHSARALEATFCQRSDCSRFGAYPF